MSVHNYFSSDGGAPDKETPTKDCDTCRGKGFRKSDTYTDVNWDNYKFVRIPTYIKCIVCDGCGVVDMDETEIWLEDRRDEQADLYRDED